MTQDNKQSNTTKVKEWAIANLKEHHRDHFVKFTEMVPDNVEIDIPLYFKRWKNNTADHIACAIFDEIVQKSYNYYGTEACDRKLENGTSAEWDEKENDFSVGSDTDENIALRILEEYFN